MTIEQRKQRIKLNRKRFGLSQYYIDNLKIPKLLSRCIGQHLNIKQIIDDKNNFSITEKIDHLKNLIKCLERKNNFIEKIEDKRKIELSIFFILIITIK